MLKEVKGKGGMLQQNKFSSFFKSRNNKLNLFNYCSLCYPLLVILQYMYVVSGTVGPLGSFGSDEAVADHAVGSNGKVVNMGIF